MASREPRAVVTLEVEPSARRQPVEVGPETPFCILLLGDFAGRGLPGADTTGAPPLRARQPVPVDRDDLDAVLRRLAPEILVPLDTGPAPEVRVRFTELDDFLPERLVARMAVFSSLRAMAESGSAPGPKGDADAAPPGPGGARPPAPGQGTAPDADATRDLAADLSRGSLLDRMLEEAGEPPAPTSPGTPREELDAFLQRITAPYLLPEEHPDAALARRRADELVAEQLRRILHHPRFQKLEALWRTVFMLTRRLETGQRLKLYLLDVSRAELEEDLRSAEETEATALHRVLSDHAPAGGTAPWALLTGLYTFGPGEEDTTLLARAAALGRALGAPFLAGASPALAGAPGFASHTEPEDWDTTPAASWTAFRHTPEARFIGLALPRFLLRLPYGEDGEPSDLPRFEEMAGPPDHESYLWGNAAALCALLLGQAFTLEGWKLRPGRVAEVTGLPLHLYRSGDETVAKPCAEAWLTEHAAQRLMDRGLMAVASMKNQDAVRLVRFQSAADPLTALAGPWQAG